MKDTLKRMLGISQAPAADAVTQEEEVTMTTDVTQTSGASAEDVTALQGTVTALTEQLAAANEKVAQLTALVDAATEFQAAQEKIAAEAKVASRLAALSAVVGTEQAASLHAATASMDDAAFSAVVSAMTVKTTVEASTPAFQEVGVEGNADKTKLAAEVSGGKTGEYLRALIEKNDLN